MTCLSTKSYPSVLSLSQRQSCADDKKFADDKINIAKMAISLFDRVENTVEKEEKCW